MSELIGNIFYKNGKTKAYALAVSVLLWAIILGQRTLVVSHEIPVNYLVGPHLIVQDSVKKITVKVSAKRSVLQNLDFSKVAPEIDLRNLPPGSKRIPIEIKSIPMPIGAKVLDIEPKFVTLYLKVKIKPPEGVDFDDDSGEKGN